ncbi:MAG: class I SAM-dependent methyltransferase [Actinomycetota bacterium]
MTHSQHPYHLPYHWCANHFYQYIASQSVDRIKNLISRKPVLDVGCGDGFVTALIARHAQTVHGIDLNPRGIAFARLIVEEPHVSFSVAKAEDISEAARQAPWNGEVITAFELIEHLEDRERDNFLLGARGLLAESKGWLILTTPNRTRPALGRARNPYHVTEYSAEELASMLHRAGFTEVAIEGLYLQPPWVRLEHFANTVPFRAIFRRLVCTGQSHPQWCRTLVCKARP